MIVSTQDKNGVFNCAFIFVRLCVFVCAFLLWVCAFVRFILCVCAFLFVRFGFVILCGCAFVWLCVCAFLFVRFCVCVFFFVHLCVLICAYDLNFPIQTPIPKSWKVELREFERTFNPKRQTGRMFACPLVHYSWLTWAFACLYKFAVDYQRHTKLCVDLQGCSGVKDEAVQAIAAANVKWVKLSLGETQITGKGISELCEKCPHLSVK